MIAIIGSPLKALKHFLPKVRNNPTNNPLSLSTQLTINQEKDRTKKQLICYNSHHSFEMPS